jgi:hypothetical protein
LPAIRMLGVKERKRPSAVEDKKRPVVVSSKPSQRSRSVRLVSLICFGPLVLLVIIFNIYRLVISETPSSIGGACQNYDGVLHISHGDVEGAAGTIFFLFVLNQLSYADQYNLLPWVHLNNISKYVYDPQVHGELPPMSFPMMAGINASWVHYVDPTDQRRFPYPGKPVQIQRKLTEQMVTVSGNGVWNSYFHSVSQFSPKDPSCRNKPMVKLTLSQIIPSLHVHCPWAIRAWRYGGVPSGLRHDELSYDEWFAPMRARGHDLIQKYVRVRSHLQELADQANPSTNCLALHIRHSDKANRRKRIPVKKFRPYVQAYAEVQKVDYTIYLATDSDKVIDEIRRSWPADTVSRIKWQKHAVRSNDTTPVFTMASHHSTNTQVLVDILAMSKCQHLLHGLSAVSEAVHYFNPSLHGQSVNLEIRKHANIPQFQSMVGKVLSR